MAYLHDFVQFFKEGSYCRNVGYREAIDEAIIEACKRAGTVLLQAKVFQVLALGVETKLIDLFKNIFNNFCPNCKNFRSVIPCIFKRQ